MRWTGIVGLLLAVGCQSTLGGKLVDKQGDPIKANAGRVNITALDRKDDSEQSVAFVVDVDKNGYFTVKRSLPKGSYLIEALVPGYKATSIRVDLEGNDKISLQLEPIPAAPAKSLDANLNVDVERGVGEATLMPPEL